LIFFAYKIALNRIEVDVQELFLYSKNNYEKNVHNDDYSNQICSIHIFYIQTPDNKNNNNKGYIKNLSITLNVQKVLFCWEIDIWSAKSSLCFTMRCTTSLKITIEKTITKSSPHKL